MPIENLASVLKHGLVSHERAEKLPHKSVAMEEVQDTRSGIRIPGGLRLHQYANTYFNARNVMMYVRSGVHRSLSVLSINLKALDVPDVVVSDSNSASENYAKFGTVDEMLPQLDYETIFAERWDHSDYYERRAHRAKMCAEVLIPNVLPPEYIRGAYVSCDKTKAEVEALALGLKVKVKPYLFFQGPAS
jgi:hypothetical protein